MLFEGDFTLRPDQRPELMLATLGTVSIAGGVAGRIASTVGPIVADAAADAATAIVEHERERQLRHEMARRRRETSDEDDGPYGDADPDDAPMDGDEIRAQLLEAFDDAREPVGGRLALWRALPEGLDTEFSSNGTTFTARELNARTQGKASFPYGTVEDLVDDLVDGMRERGHVA